MKDELRPNICAYAKEELVEALKKRPPIEYTARRDAEDELCHIKLPSRPSRRLRVQCDGEYDRKVP